MQLVVDQKEVPLALSIDSASVGETSMFQQTLGFTDKEVNPRRLIGDKGYDSDALDQTLAELDIEMIAPKRINRSQTQDPTRCGVTATAGWLNVPLPGCKTTAACSFDTKSTLHFSVPLLPLAAS